MAVKEYEEYFGIIERADSSIIIHTSEPIKSASLRMNFGNGLGIAGNAFNSESHQDKQA
jgi:hypothetical protein